MIGMAWHGMAIFMVIWWNEVLRHGMVMYGLYYKLMWYRCQKEQKVVIQPKGLGFIAYSLLGKTKIGQIYPIYIYIINDIYIYIYHYVYIYIHISLHIQQQKQDASYKTHQYHQRCLVMFALTPEMFLESATSGSAMIWYKREGRSCQRERCWVVVKPPIWFALPK